MHDGLENNVKEVNDKILNNLAISGAKDERKFVVVYYYNDDYISIHYKAISGLSIFKDSFMFLAYHNPPQEMLK